MRPYAITLLALLACCPVAGAQEIRLQQADGSELLLAAPAQRIVTLSPHLAEGLYAAGAGDRLQATVEYSEYPPEAASVPRIGDAFRLDIERIMALRPDLVIAWDSGNPRAAVNQLRTLGLVVWSVEIREPAAIADFIADAGRAAGTAADAVAQRLRRRLADLARRYESAPPVSYFYQVDEKPLFTISGDHLISRGLALCGGVNVFAAEPGLAFQVSRESVVLADPAALIAPGVDGAPDPLGRWRDWPGMQAVREGALFLLPADEISRATPRFVDSIEQACKLLHQSSPGENHG